MIKELRSQYSAALESGDIRSRINFVKNLTECKTEECIRFHIEIMQDQTDNRFYHMIRASLKKRGDTVIPILMEIIRTYPDSSLKADAIRTVGNLRYKESLSLIETYLDSKNRDTRYASIIALGWMGSKKQIDLLFAVYKSENDALLRGYAITALRQIFFNHNEEKHYIISGINKYCLEESEEDTQRCIILSVQTISEENFGLIESAQTGNVTGNAKKAWLNLLKYFLNIQIV